MKKIRIVSRNPFVIIVLLINFVFVSCKRGSIIEEISEERKENAYSGKELFESIIFADGNATNSIPILKQFSRYKSKLTEEQLNEYREIKSKVIKYIENKNPHFFSEFKEQMTSNNPVIVKQSLDSTREMLMIAFKDLGMLNDDSLENIMKSADNSDHMISPNGVAAYVAVTVVAVVFAGIFIWITKTEFDDVIKESSLLQDKTLNNDRLVIEIANNL